MNGVSAGKEKPRRLTANREHRLALVSHGMIQGRTQQELSGDMGVSQQQISRDWREVLRRWRESELVDTSQLRMRQLAEVNALKQEAWSAWLLSKKDAEKITTNEGGKEDSDWTRIERKGQTGDARYLDVINRCLEREARLLGLDEALPIDLSSGGEAIKIREVIIELPTEKKD